MSRVIDLATAIGSDLDIFGDRLEVQRGADPRESDSDYRSRLLTEHQKRKTKNTPFSNMTLRDYFAAKAMQSILALGEAYDYEGGTPVDQLPRHAYALADAMLAERAK